MTDPTPSESAPAPKTGLGMYRQLSRPFWVTNTMELLERGAWYTLLGILSAYLGTVLGLTATSIGLVLLLFYPLAYVTPLLSGALGEKFGYKRMLLAAFLLLTAGYATFLLSASVPFVIAGIILAGLGAGIFKPLAMTLVADTTTVDQRQAAYALYYGGVNLGGFAFPLLAGYVGTLYPDYLYTGAFVMSTILVAVNLTIVLTAFRNVREPKPSLSVGKALGGLGDALGNPSFLILCALYSGLWMMYAAKEAYLSIYMLEFARMPAGFNASYLAAISPLVIVVVAALPFLGMLAARVKSLFLIAIGIVGWVAGLLLIGFTNDPVSFILGIVVFSIGEVIAQPAFLAYVSTTAPPDKVAIYQSYGGLPLGFGLAVGAFVGGLSYDAFVVGMGRPALFWAAVASIGIVTLTAILLYNAFLTRRAEAASPTAPARRIGALGRGVLVAAALLLVVPGLLGASTLIEGEGRPDGDGLGAASVTLATFTLPVHEDATTEGATTELIVTLPENATGNATITLRWIDEAPAAGQSNAPDTFRMNVTLPDGRSFESPEGTNPVGEEGRITFDVPALPGAYTVKVTAVACGDTAVQVGPIAVPQGGSADGGNAWTLETSHEAPTVEA